MTKSKTTRLIECDEFPFEFLSHLAERESWRKEIHRPIYHVHKWWAKRLGSVFRGLILGCKLPPEADLSTEFYRAHNLSALTVFDPFMGSGTTIGEAHKLGCTAIGRDINPVAVEAVKTALGPLDRERLHQAFAELERTIASELKALHRSRDKKNRDCDVLYWFWVMQASCPTCNQAIDLFTSHVIARNAYPDRKPEVQIHCAACGVIFTGTHGETSATCPTCRHSFDPTTGNARGTKAYCATCDDEFPIIKAVASRSSRPDYRLFAKLVLTNDGKKEYIAATEADLTLFRSCSEQLRQVVDTGEIKLPNLDLEHGYNTKQAMGYGFKSWRDFFNDRQLLALSRLRKAILRLSDPDARRALLTLFSGVLEFNNLFASYKGEGTGAVRHMFSHHILKPERMPIEANVWGTPKSSGSFSTLFPSRLLRAIDYREQPTEVNGQHGTARQCSEPFTGTFESSAPSSTSIPRSIYLSCGDSSASGLADRSVDLVVTDPPFFDNVHYSELADFFFAWQQLDRAEPSTTRHEREVQDADASYFSEKLCTVFSECHRVLRDEGLLVFTYHHSRPDGWVSLAAAIFNAGFVVTNSHPVKAEMAVATPKSQAKEPIGFDIVIVCRKRPSRSTSRKRPVEDAVLIGESKIQRLLNAGFVLSRNDRRIILLGQVLTAIDKPEELMQYELQIDRAIEAQSSVRRLPTQQKQQRLLFVE